MARRVWPFLLLALLVGMAYLPLFSGQVLYQRDVVRHLYPEQAFLHESYRTGDSSLWNPMVGLGISTLANPLNEVFYPPSALVMVAHSPRATSFFLFFHLVLGGLGIMVLLRRLAKVPVSAALVAGLAWCLSGCTTSEVIAGVLLVAGAYLPWCGLGFVHLARLVRGAAPLRQRLTGVAWAALPLGLCFATGEVFCTVLASGFAICVALGDAWATPAQQPPRRHRAAQVALGFCAAVGLAAALASVVLYPAQQAAQGTDRTSALPRQVAEVGSLHPWRVVELLAQGAMGDPYTSYPAGPWVGEPGLGDRPLLYGVYAGCGVLALALLALGRRRRLAAVLAATAGFFLLVSFGRHLGLHGVLRVLVPPLAFMRGPEKYLAIVTASVSLLAGLGCARILEDHPGPLWRRSLLVPLCLATLALAAGLFPRPMVESVRLAAVYTLGVGLAAVALAWLAGRAPRWAGPLLVGLVLVDLTRGVFALQNFVAPEQLGAPPAAARAVLQDARARGRLAPPRVYRPPAVDPAIASAKPPTSLAEVQRNLVGTLIDNHAGSFGIGSLPGYDAALPTTLSSLWQVGLGAGLGLLRLTGTEYVLLAQTPQPPDLQPLLDPAPGVRLFRVAGVLPRVYLSRAKALLPDSAAKMAVFDPDVVAGRHVVLATTPAAPSTVAIAEPDATSPGDCRLTAFAHARVEAACEASSAALAVFVEQYDRGWSATVDGQPAPVLRANLAMRAVPLAPGRHQVVLTFSPPGLRTGIILSLAALVAWLALLLGLFVRPTTAG
jgi:hypothetical protein